MPETEKTPPPFHTELRFTTGAWFSTILLIISFTAALIIFPPVTDAGTTAVTPTWMKFFGHFHVIVLHLPIGVLAVVAMMELFVLIRHRTSEHLNTATTLSLSVGAWSAAVAVVFGIFLAKKGGIDNENGAEFYAHQALGIASAVVIILSLVLKLLADAAPVFTWPYRVAFGLALLVMTVGAHFGGNLVHGSDYLTRNAPVTIQKIVEKTEAPILAFFQHPKPAVPPGQQKPVPLRSNNPDSSSPTVYAALVAPLLEKNCYSCHNAEKTKGGLRLDTHDLIIKGGKGGETVVAGQPEKSKLITSMQLPPDDEDHMPPPKKPQPDKDEIALLAWWVKEGASKDLKIAEARMPDEFKSLAEKLMATGGKGGGGSTPPSINTAAAGGIFKDIVQPVLQEKCISCHGKDKSKGKLRMHTFADMMKGGSDGPTAVVPGKPAESLMIKRMLLPADDDDHMPPKDEKQPTKEEIAILRWWIEQGADEKSGVADAKKNPEIEAALKLLTASRASSAGHSKKDAAADLKTRPLTPEEKKTADAVSAKMAAFNTTLMPISLDTEQLRFSCINSADKFGDAELAELAPAAALIVWADLGRSKVTDAGLPVIAKMISLEQLHLEKTAVTDAGLDQLAALPNLQYLNLYGTKITDAGLLKLASIKTLKKLYVWQTGATPEGAKKLESLLPGLVVNIGLVEPQPENPAKESPPPTKESRPPEKK